MCEAPGLPTVSEVCVGDSRAPGCAGPGVVAKEPGSVKRQGSRGSSLRKSDHSIFTDAVAATLTTHWALCEFHQSSLTTH